MKKILGLGNALVDVLVLLENEKLLHDFGLEKGAMYLIDNEMVERIVAETEPLEKHLATGGSVANTISGIARLGTESGFIGKIGNDEIGLFFKNDMNKNNIHVSLSTSNTRSGQCYVFVTPDGERTMCTYLGAAAEIGAQELHSKLFKGYDIFHVEGYLVQNYDLIKTAIELAKQENLLVSIDLASFNVVDTHLAFLKEIIPDKVDIVFANEKEAFSFTGKLPEEALHQISHHCKIAIVKVGEDGSFIKTDEQTLHISAKKAACVDTTGAGDLYAAGFLHGLAKGYSIDICGNIVSLVSGNVVEVIGAKMDNNRWKNIHSKILDFRF